MTNPQSGIPQQPFLAPTRTSRSVVIGLGDFGLHVISLLLPRLEAYDQFVVRGAHPFKVLTRCGLIGRRFNQLHYLDLDRDVSLRALCAVREIQHTVLVQPSGSAQTTRSSLQALLGIENAWDGTISQHDWVIRLTRPVLADAWDYATSFAHLHMYLVVSADDQLMQDVYQLAQTLRKLQASITVNLIINVGFTTESLWQAEQNAHQVINQLQAYAQRELIFHHMYVVDHSKINQALTELPGEAAMMVCNFIDTTIFSMLGDTLAERLLPDTDDSLRQSPYSALGAAKLYVPVAEISSELVGAVVAQMLRERLTQEPSATDVTAQQTRAAQELDLLHVGRVSVRDLPVTVRPRFSRWQRLWMNRPRVRALSFEQEEERERQRQLMGLPHVQLRRRYWHTLRRAYGRRLPPDVWWSALEALEGEVTRQLPSWLATAARQLGVSLHDEQISAHLAHALSQRDPIAQDLQNGAADLRALKLREWVIQRRADLGAQAQQLEADAKDQLVDRAHTSGSAPDIASSWLGWWLWLRPGTRSGYVLEQTSQLKRECADLIANSRVGLRLALARLAALQESHQIARQSLVVWAAEMHGLGTQTRQQFQQQQLEHRKQQLIVALRNRPYWSGWIWRLLLTWLIPLCLALIAIQGDMSATLAQVATEPSRTVALWTAGVVAFYTLILLGTLGRVWLAKRRIERFVLERIDQQIETAFYAGIDHGTPGPTVAYLNAFNRLVVAPMHQYQSQPSSLLATAETTLALLSQETQLHGYDAPPECVVYRSICEESVRQILETRMNAELRPQADGWSVDSAQIASYLHGPESLTAYIRRTLRTSVMNQYIRIARGQPGLQLQSLLNLPEHRAVIPGQLLSDIRLRAKPFLDLSSSPQASEETRETVTYISVPDTTPPLVPVPKEHHVFLNQSCDPFGITCLSIVNGIAHESLPFRQAGATVP